VYLGHDSVVSLHNVVDLYACANSCNAVALKKLCLYHLRTMFDVIKQMPEWIRLDEALKKEVIMA